MEKGKGQSRKESDQKDDEEVDPYSCYIEEEQPVQQPNDMKALHQVIVDMEE